MHETKPTSSEQIQARERIHRRDLVNSLLIGIGLGALLLGAPLGWFAHRFYAQQRTAQVLLCRQQNFGLSETELQARCGQPY
ncbi:hypothetical protein HJG54_34435 [Leptolyngbya sp. NK1-12]|jgi:hypothetical protein|uniref:Uncharacterized protein n=1 Tax=Leptolyngbya sp. NK1-12 TaxID=2547451 RepID=A0AA96WLJ2_9CYAN|nr:hypothetical protein [Leptolyngbya sp. NK1-12]RNJ64566.1 MAG: hypothetical protein EDM05_35860 [Leptolyngbya sp. IPPAS B-1204]RNJ64696.1 MAG: hypothetical protein EDM05_35145 [Leptolyngbya sp. IPPAS B-1204]WNZ26870.1 hypothetical protein HJG54_28480 [Leptolyngbya sp. NK1-12]WNZ27918.1 hypothetical protein HJG54_34435 [Leptolyngbya sp. NK1-12]